MRLNKATRYLKISYIIHFFFFTLKGNCFIEFCGFLSYINKDQPLVHTCPLPPEPPFHLPPHTALQPVREPLFEFPESYSKFPLAIYFTYGNINLHVTLSTHLTHFSPTLCPQVCSLCLFLCCPENKFISTIFLDSIYMHQYMIYTFLFLTYFTLYNRLQVRPPHQN